MNDWRVNSYLQSDGLTLTIYEYVPEHLYDQFAVLMTELMNGIIREDSQEHFSQTGEDIKQRMEFYKKSRVEMLTLLLFDSGHELIGISFMLLYPNSVVAKQYMTGIKNQYRGKKLAGYLKAMITEEAFRRFSNIEKIETDCNLANKPMIYINQHTGYTLKKNSFQFKVETAKIEEFLAAG
jgi:RimJ/RimL family protein N-acetyltransferase